MDKFCPDCRYWRGGEHGFGECRKNSPVIVLGMIKKDCLEDEKTMAIWPEVYESDWCGEWAAIEPPSVFDKMAQLPPFTDFINRLRHNRTAHVLSENKVTGWSELFKADFDWFKNCGTVTRRDIARTCYELTKIVPTQLARYYQPPTETE